MKKFDIKMVFHKKQRYDTPGDYFENHNVIKLRISKLKNDDWEFLVFLHEVVEMWLCRSRGIDFKEIDYFDQNYEGENPGDDENAPYHKEHLIASEIEKKVGRALKVNWKKYNDKLKSLKWR